MLIISRAVNGTISVLMVAAAIVLGLLLRRLLINRLKKTVLDTWIIQTLGVIVVVIPSILGITGAMAIWNASFVANILSIGISQAKLFDLLGPIIQTLLIGALGYGIARTAKALTIRGIGDNRIDINMRTLFGRVLYFTILSISAFFILSAWNIPVGVPVAVLGAFTVTLTLAFQNVLINLVSGLYILVERPFYIGDQIYIPIPGIPVPYIGKVEDIQLRATRLKLTSGESVSVPNLLIFNNAVVNNTHYGERRSILEVTLPVADFSRDEMTSFILSAIREYNEVMPKPEPAVMISGYEEDKVILQVRFWVATGQVIDISSVLYELHELIPNSTIKVIEPR